MRLYEFGRGGDVSPGKRYRHLYHLCDYVGFSYTLAEDALRSRSSYVSTTWDQTMNNVVGKSFALFKFVLDGNKLIENYGAFHYDDSAQVVGTRQRVSHNEREIGIASRDIAPFGEYHIGTVLMFDLFSESGLQWLLYRNRGRASGFMTQEIAPTKQAIHTLYDHVFVLRRPLWKSEVGTPLSKQELSLLREAYRISHLNMPFTKALEHMAGKFPIVDTWKKTIDRETYIRRHMAPKMVELLNDYYGDRKAIDVDVSVVRRLITRCIAMLQLGNNAEAVIIHALDESGLFHPRTEAVEWGGILRSIMSGDIDEAIETIHFFRDRDLAKREHWNLSSEDDGMKKYVVHSRTDFGRGPSSDW